MSSKLPLIPDPCEHAPIRVPSAWSEAKRLSEFICALCGVRWFVNETSPLLSAEDALEAIETQMGFFEDST